MNKEAMPWIASIASNYKRKSGQSISASNIKSNKEFTVTQQKVVLTELIAVKQSLITNIEGCLVGNIPTNGGRLALSGGFTYTVDQLVIVLKSARQAAGYASRAKHIRSRYSAEDLANPFLQNTDRKIFQSVQDLNNAKAIITRLGIREVQDEPVLA